jgi:Fe-Mn family superoxide dismutase
MQRRSGEDDMKRMLPELPYKKDALEPYLGELSVDVHYEQHQRGHLEKLARLVAGKPEANESLEDLIRTATGDVYDSAAEAWNHAFYWKSLKPGGSRPAGKLLARIETSFGSLPELQRHLVDVAAGHFGSGWVWLILGDGERLHVTATSDAENPLRDGETPLLAIDLWEHAYYLDYLSERKRYVRSLVEHLIDWDFAAENLRRAMRGAAP